MSRKGWRNKANRALRELVPGAGVMLDVLEHVHDARGKAGLTKENYEAILGEIERGLIIARDEMTAAVLGTENEAER